MYNNYFPTSDKKDKSVVKLYTWMAYDIWLCGLIIYNWVVMQIQAFANALDSVEKMILTLCTVVFAGYRIYILHLEAKKKKLETEEMEYDLKEKKTKRG